MASYAIQRARRLGPAIPALRGENLEYLAFVINGPPRVVRLAVDPDEHLVQVPASVRNPPRRLKTVYSDTALKGNKDLGSVDI